MARNSTAIESREDYEAHDAMHTLMRAGEIVKDKKLLSRVRKKAAEHAAKMRDVADRAGQLAKKGLISDKAMAKHVTKRKGGNASNQDGKTADLDKTGPIA